MELKSFKDMQKRVQDELSLIKEMKIKIDEREKGLVELAKALDNKALQADIDLSQLDNNNNNTSKVKSEPIKSVSIYNMYPDYPFNKDRKERIAYIVKKYGLAIRMRDIQDIITQLEGASKSKKTLKSFNYALTQMVGTGMLLMGKIANSNKHTFYIVPEFLNDSNKLKEMHYPGDDARGGMPIEKWDIQSTTWIGKTQ